jgi:hypothetical protein
MVRCVEEVEEVEAEPGEDLALVRDRLIEDDVVGGDAIGGHEEKVVRIHLVYLSDLP